MENKLIASLTDESAMAIVRIAVGCMMAFGHGMGKLPPKKVLLQALLH